MRVTPFVCALAGVVGASAAGCATPTFGRMNVLEAKADAQHPPSYAGLPLKTGQLFLTEAPGPYSFVFVLIPEKFYPFTHASIISIEDGQPWVYDISGEYRVGFNEHVMDNVEGGMRRTPFVQYAQANLYGEVFDPPPGVNGELVAAFARQQLDSGVKFDAYFRFDEHQKLFCTELVELALEAGGQPRRPLDRVRDNPSLKAGMAWLGVPLETALPAGVFIGAPAQYRAAVGQFGSRTAAYAYFEAKREIHRRFKKDQRLGYLFELHSSGDIVMRPDIEEFVVHASHAFEDQPVQPPPGDERITKAVRKIADERFGPVPD